jgi:hypothetical protein
MVTTTYVGAGLDANGWTTFTPSSDTRIIYVSSSTGSDSNNGLSQNAAVATIDKGLSLIRNGSADWLLLKAGDTWVNQEIGYLEFSGRSATEPILISSYGTGARPLIETGPNGSGAAIGGFNNGHSNIAIVGLDFYAHTRDPSNPNFAGPGPEQYGMRFVSQVNNLLVEDCKFSFYNDSTIEGSGSGNVILRRNIIADNYDTTSHSEGLYVDHVANLVLEQNLFDHNGWNSSVSGAAPTIFNHNLYIQDTSGLATVIGNIFANASATGAQVRPGGTVIDNLFVHNPVGFQIGSSQAGMFASTATVSGNVVTEGSDITSSNPRGFGILLYPNTGLVQVQNNIVTNEASSGSFVESIWIAQGADNDIVTNNIIYNWGGQGAFYNFGSGNITSPNAIDQTGYLDPNRSVETYMASLGGGATLAAFIAAARNQSKTNWDPRYTADAVNSYIEAGFVTTVGGLAGSLSINDVTISEGNGTITNDDGAVIAGSISINDVTISEGNSGTRVATFTVTRSGGTAAFGVDFATSNASATVADSDYAAATGTLNFGANENTKTISVAINGDTKVEANEIFNVLLSNATNGATISDSQSVGTISNDDGAPTANLVVNGGFETGNFSGWTLSGNSSGNQIYIAPTAFPGEVHTGSYSAGLGSMNRTDGILTQNIATTAGQHYTLSFWIESDNNGSTPINHFAAEWNGQTLMALTDAPDSGYQLYTFDVVGINGNSVLEFDAYNHPDAWRLDDVTLTAVGVAVPVTPLFTSGADTVTLPLLGGSFNALGGNDKLAYTGGPVTIDGGTDSDTVDFSQFNSAVWVNLVYDDGEIWTQDRPDLSSDSWRAIGDLTNVENLVGTVCSDFLQGNNGANTLQGGDGNDTLTGGGGADTFVFDHLGAGSQDQHDVIVDFRPGVDRIDLAATPVNDFADLFTVGDRYMEQVGNDILIHTSVSADTSILLQNVQLANVTQSDFLF